MTGKEPQENPKVVTVCSAYKPEERAHFSATLATTLVQMNVRLLLVDLDAECRATRQAFGPLRKSDEMAGDGPILGPVRRSDLVRQKLDLFQGRFFRRSVYLYVLPGRRDLRRFAELDEGEIEPRFQAFLASIAKRFDLVLFDAPQLPSNLAHVAMRGSRLLLVPVRAGRGCEAEVLSAAPCLKKAKVPVERLAVTLTCMDTVSHLSEELDIAMERLQEKLKSDRTGRLFSSRIRHDISTLGTHGVEDDTRDDWISVSSELLHELEARED